jgi:hypothetical protein
VVETLGELVADLQGFDQRFSAGFPQVLRQGSKDALLLLQPGRVVLHDRFQGGPQRVGTVRSERSARTSRRCSGQGSHVEYGTRHIGSIGLGRLHGGHPGGTHLKCPARLRLAGLRLPHTPVGRAGAPYGELEAIAILELEAGLFRAGIRPRTGRRENESVVDGKEDVPTVGIDMDLGLEHPCVYGDPAGRDLIVAQGELDEITPAEPADR